MSAPEPRDVRDASTDIGAAARTIRASTDGPPANAERPGDEGVDVVGIARAVIDGRRRLSLHLPSDLFADPVLEVLLDLYIAGGRDERRTIESAAIASRVPGTTALRWIGLLVERGLVERLDDPRDGRITLLRLSDMARRGMLDWLTGCADSSHRR